MASIYFDESGFTGDHLLDREQPYFVYASVRTDGVQAKDLLDEIARLTKTTASELKAGKLLRSRLGRDALTWLLEQPLDARIFALQKAYSLAAWIFEFTIEPLFSAENSFFYEIGFHRFIANLLFAHFVASGAPA